MKKSKIGNNRAFLLFVAITASFVMSGLVHAGSVGSITLSPATNTIDVGQSITFTNVTTILSPLTYSYTYIGVGAYLRSGNKITFLDAGTYTVQETVTNSSVEAANVATITVDPLPTVILISQYASLDAGQNDILTATVSGGTNPYVYSFADPSGNTVSCLPVVAGTTATCEFTATSNGVYSVSVNDVNLVAALPGTALVTVNPDPTATTPSFYNLPIDLGQSTTLSTTLSGGSGIFTANFIYANGTVANSQTGVNGKVSWAFSPTTTNAYAFNVVAIDTGIPIPYVFNTVSSNSITANPQLIAAAPSVSNTIMDKGQYTVFSVNPSGGTPPYSYQWYGGAIGSQTCPFSSYGAAGRTGNFVRSTVSIAGTFYCYKLTDSASPNDVVISPQVASPIEYPAPSATGLAFSNSPVDVGQSTTLSTTVSGGSGTFMANFIYANGTVADSQTGVGSAITWAFSPTTSNTYTFNVVITDTGTTYPYTFNTISNSITPNPLLKIMTTPSANSVNATNSITFTSNAVGGTPPYTFNYIVNNTAGVSISNNIITFANGGTYNVIESVTDNAGNTADSEAVTIMYYWTADNKHHDNTKRWRLEGAEEVGQVRA